MFIIKIVIFNWGTIKMKYHTNLLKNTILPVLKKNINIQSVIIYGSLARNDENINSDIDLMLWVENENLMSELLYEIRTIFSKSINVVNRNKIVSYFENIKIEFSYSETLDGNNFKRNYIGSAIPKDKILDSILLDKTNQAETILLNWYNYEQNTNKKLTTQKTIDTYITSFIYEFEQASNFHRRADSYRCYFFYNISLNTAIRLYHLLQKPLNNRFNFLPKYIAYNMETSKTDLHQLSGTLNLQKLNEKKRLLLNFFYEIIEDAIDKNKFLEIQSICEYFYERDKLWNFRDIAKNIIGIQKGKIFRSGMFAIYTDDEIRKTCKNNNIKKIIDLRAARELKETPYSDQIIEELNYTHVPFDPWNQPQEFIQSKYHKGTNVEIAYNFFIHACKNQINHFFNILAEAEDAVLIHCVSGKDRTGTVVSLFHLLMGISQEEIYVDYLASETDTHEDKINIVLKYVEQSGGIEKYLFDCGVSTATINLLKNKYKSH